MWTTGLSTAHLAAIAGCIHGRCCGAAGHLGGAGLPHAHATAVAARGGGWGVVGAAAAAATAAAPPLAAAAAAAAGQLGELQASRGSRGRDVPDVDTEPQRA